MTTTSTQQEEPAPWKHSNAKKLLAQDILDGKTNGKSPKEVYSMHPEYKLYNYTNFSTNLRNLKESLLELSKRAAVDEAAFRHDESLGGLKQNSKPYPRWGGQPVQVLLKKDIDEGKHQTMTPEALRNSRQEYLLFPKKIFRDHIYQELRERRERPYWLARKREKEMKKAEAKQKKQQK